jgi:uncharacterized RDD family membrane protein YckC
MEIFLVTNGVKTGPMSIYEVRDLLRKDKINTSTLAWTKGMKKWEPLRECPPLKNSIDVEIAETGFDEIVVTNEERDSIKESTKTLSKPRPWIRLWSKLIDFPIHTFLGFLFLKLYLGEETIKSIMGPEALESLLKNESNTQPELETLTLITITMIISWIITEGIFLACFTTTLGKWILNIETLKLNGKRIDPLTALIRSFYVLVFGFGLWVFPFLFICPVISYISLIKKKSTQWDRWLKLQVTHKELTGLRILAGIFALFVTHNLLGLLLSLGQTEQINQ